MLLNHDFTVDIGIEEAWSVFTDLERVATCFPGAEMTNVDGDVYHGRMRVKVGPISTQYAGTARFQALDSSGKRAIIAATGRDSKGQGTAAATVEVQLSEERNGTAVHVETDLAITGKVAQFGRGALGEVSQQLLEVFLQRLEDSLKNPEPEVSVTSDDEQARAVPASSTKEADVLNLNYVVALPLLKKAAPTVIAMALTAIVVRRISRRT